jgi:N6-adenosine-specific RNA methylase IME4
MSEQSTRAPVLAQDQLKIDREFESLIQPLEADERAQLEANLLADGCRDPLVCWSGTKPPTLLDGHNRFGICKRHGIAYRTVTLAMPDRFAARNWIINNQLGRRNITPEYASYLRGLRYNAEKGSRGKNHQSDVSTSERLAKELKVGEATIVRDGEFAAAVDKVAEIGGDEARKAILSRGATVARKEVKKIAQVAKKEPEKAKQLLGSILAGEAKSVKQVEKKAAAEKIQQEPPPLPEGPFRVIVADPPWSYDSRSDDATHRAANPYASMPIEAIKAMPVRKMAHEDCVLWLWTTNAHMRQAFEVLDAWGFAHKTILTWVKDRMGTGDWLRGQTEHCLMAVRGKPVVTLTSQTTAIRGPLREHSRKPEEFYALVETLCPGSKIELFARTQRKGWVAHGNEPERFSQPA